MAKVVLTIVLAIAAGIFQASFISALPFPFSTLHLPLLLCVVAIMQFNFRNAHLIAFFSALSSDALSPYPFGVNLIILLTVTTVLVALFTRVVTHVSLLGTAALHATSYLFFHILISTAALIITTFVVNSPFSLLWSQRLPWIALGVLIHTSAALLYSYGFGRLRSAIQTLFFTS